MPKEQKEKKVKDKNAPKKALAPYMCFCKEMREVVKKENEGISFGEIGKVLGKKWAALDEKGKKKYVALSEKDKERYAAEMKAYEKA